MEPSDAEFQNSPIVQHKTCAQLFYLFIYFSDPPGIQWVTRRVSLGKKKPRTLRISGLKVKFQAAVPARIVYRMFS